MSMTLADTVPRDPNPVPDIPSSVFAQMDMRGRVVCITGGADGIGLAVAEAMAEAHANVALWYNSNDAAIERARELEETYGIRAKAWKVQVMDYEAVEKAMGEVVGEFGRLDVFVANAGMAISKKSTDMSIEEYRKLMSVNVDGVFYCAKSAGSIFESQGFGNLIITSSISAHIVNVPIDQPVYNASKAAISHLGKSLAREWRSFARVNIVSPGFFDTKMGAAEAVRSEAYRMTPLGRQGHVKEIKGVFLWLASDASTYVTGSDVLIDGGYTLP